MILLTALFALTVPVQQEAAPPEPRAKAPVPINQPQRWITSKDYPASSRRAKHDGVVGFKLEIGADGSVTDCAIVQSSGHVMLDKGTCDLLMERAQVQACTGPQRRGDPGQLVQPLPLDFTLRSQDTRLPTAVTCARQRSPISDETIAAMPRRLSSSA